jgi:hypothetical protein
LVKRRATTKWILLVAGKDAKKSCGIDQQLCDGLEAGVEGGRIHPMQYLWDRHHMEEEWGFLLIDARNGFNEGNQTGMLGQFDTSGRWEQDLHLIATNIGLYS